ncbi:MAG: hypothetical protein HC935_01825 [Pseudanabaena sp. SU_2_4]|nr:hypothetical protein [Pseudanabaena sp. SU_2_4]
MADLIKALFNKKKKVVPAESEKPVAQAKSTESKKPVASAKPAKLEEKATETTTTPAPEVKAKGGLGGLFSSKKKRC